MGLLDHVGQVEVGGAGPYQIDGGGQVEAAQEGIETGMCLRSCRQAAQLLDQVGQVGAHLAGQGLLQQAFHQRQVGPHLGRVGRHVLEDAVGKQGHGGESRRSGAGQRGLDGARLRFHTVSMPNILIRDVPVEVHSELARRAGLQGRSLQQYLTALLTGEAATRTLDDVLDSVARLGGGQVTLAEALAARDESRAER